MSSFKDCTNCWVFHHTEWNVLSQYSKEIINEARRIIIYMEGETIFHQGDTSHGIYCLESGHILLKHLDVFGEQTNFQLVKYGETFGWRSFFAEQLHTATAIALSRCKVCFVPGNVIKEIISNEPDLAFEFLKTIARDRGPSEALMLRSPHLPVQLRFVYFLSYMKDRFAKQTRSGDLIYSIPLKKQDMASMLGTRRETLSRVIHELESKDLVRFKDKEIIVSHPDKLFKMIGMHSL